MQTSGRWFHRIFQLRSPGVGCHLVTSDVNRQIRNELRAVKQGCVHLLCQTAGCSLSLNENADPSVRDDLLAASCHLVPEGQASALVKAALFRPVLDLPVTDGRFSLGTWQVDSVVCFALRVVGRP